MSNDLEAQDNDICITCGDVAVVLEVIERRGSDALCRAIDGGTEMVAVDLVDHVQPGELLLVHARVALTKVVE
jgi:hypothetical protein